MTDADFKAQQKRIQALVKKWPGPLGLKWWSVTYAYARSLEEMPQGIGVTKDALACTETNWPYMRATITWNMENVKDSKDDYLEFAFVHECCHIFVNEMHADYGRKTSDHEERVCSTLAQAFLWVLEAGKDKK